MPSAEPDIASVKPSILLVLAGVFLSLAGIMVAASGMQMFIFIWLLPWQKVIVGWMTLIGMAGLLTGPFLIKGRGWAAIGGSLIAALMALTTGLWWVYMLVAFSFSLLIFMAAGMASASAILTPFTVPSAIRVSKARKALYDPTI